MNKILIIIFVFIIGSIQAQINLVLNPSFEDFYYCPTKCNGMTQVKNWELSDFSSDYFNKNCNNGLGPIDCPINNSIGSKLPRTGNGCAGLAGASEVLECKLISPMIKDSVYYFELYVILGNYSKYTTDDLGVYFSQKKISRIHDSQPFSEIYNLNPQIKNIKGNFIEKQNWQKISGTYKASGDEQFMLISGFKNIWNYKELDNTLSESPYLYIDDILLVKSSNKDSKYMTLLNGGILRLNKIFFSINESKLLQESHFELDSLCDFLKENINFKIKISGHTDNTGKQNLELSENRAKAVYDYLFEKGILRERMTYIGYGSSKPIANNESEEGRAINRRVEIELQK